MDQFYRSFSSYLTGQFGQKTRKIVINAGFTCPNRDGTISWGGCMYCNETGSGSGSRLSVPQQVEEQIRFLRQKGFGKFIVYFQSFSNTYGSLEMLKKTYDSALIDPDIVGISIGTRPDCLDTEKIDLIRSYADRFDVWVELGLQTVNEKTLKFINRGHTVPQFQESFERLKKAGIKICVHIILGLPDETRADMIHTADFLGHLAPEGLKIHGLYIEKGTRIEEIYNQENFPLLSMEEYVSACCDVLEYQDPWTVIQRLTGDIRVDRLVGPAWIRDKNLILQEIGKEFVKRGTRQGSRKTP
jgi:uncharacterized protein